MEKRTETIEQRAKRLGVALAGTAAPAATEPGRAPMPAWVQRAMPHGADLLAELKAGLDPETWQLFADNLRSGRGYVVDLSTNIALGNPPVMEWERGRVERRDGFTVMRVRSKATV